MASVEPDGVGNLSRKQPSIHEICEAAVDEVLANVNTVQYLIKSIEEISNTPFRRERIKCVPQLDSGGVANASWAGGSNTMADGTSAAGYMWRRARRDCEKGDILLIEQHVVLDKATENDSIVPGAKTCTAVERNLRHELIHAFDDARGIIEASDCMHQACSEVRAARLSGDCFVGEEMRRGRFDLLSGGIQCVRRRAITAVEKNPLCRGFSERAVERIFKQCYSDYEPFAAPLYSMGSYGDEKFEL
ncbi:Peptidase M76 family, putative [Trypanosoma equiperdum]|uniref:Mitochondrial inner membrane protease ATP23 n=4 Tax=Trypanozoon TaxID=39700 RepID=Q38AZ4_TRYB2|nr:hypothetical protein, conserved [Trypanosoma brucei gambiense DAL972]XP_822854.1 hypothetical protein, conserved [Trypanosoma brucei brucei TREU927]RHW69475.1 Peptidase M76 family [Trypanosoma brucei equiperdum]SCU73174.1 Peptidase M76 family, putative [Trypanosoma equiperdum]EAN78026.1 hypothetical protein, conserved [Trypanosoma brucei brucei TREU927]CBH15660.1 hypothetical protein, conserved [Trypanosoma brucei gambiense DAL972]|eukprot:XP_011777924.1 hypothetical protein, conserved [Trypanosoma brucei gambiense DAL972]